MGGQQSKENNGLDPNQNAKTASWQQLAEMVFEKPSGSESIVLFTRDPLTDPCVLVGKSIIQVANDLAKKDNAVAFAVGEGPCPQCNVPTLFWWNGRDWQNSSLGDIGAVLRAVNGYVLKQGLQTVYHVYGDKDLKITKVSHNARISNGEVTLAEGCTAVAAPIQNSVVNGTKNLQETLGSGNIIFWIILILLIILIIWLLFRRRV